MSAMNALVLTRGSLKKDRRNLRTHALELGDLTEEALALTSSADVVILVGDHGVAITLKGHGGDLLSLLMEGGADTTDEVPEDRYEISLPNRDGSWDDGYPANPMTKEAALALAKKQWGADDEGRIYIINDIGG